ncbi:MAG TPA: dephospho-CoA kinase [Stellaceae bacterium]
MIILGLTGSIGMGKSTAAAALRGFGLPVFDADRVVHRLLAPGGAAVARVAGAFEGVRDAAGGIDRSRLGKRVFADRNALSRLEAIIHPLVETAERRFLARARGRRKAIAVLDIPLLFETGAECRCDYVLVVTAPPLLQRQRVLRRPGMSEDRLHAVMRQQMPDREKRRRTDFVVSTGLSRNHALRQLRRIVDSLLDGTAPASRRRALGERRARS